MGVLVHSHFSFDNHLTSFLGDVASDEILSGNQAHYDKGPVKSAMNVKGVQVSGCPLRLEEFWWWIVIELFPEMIGSLGDSLTRRNDISSSPGNEDDGVGKRLLGLTGDVS
jgi:hypothetical protein